MAVIIKEAAYVIVHVPDCIRYGSKPARDIEENPGWLQEIEKHQRSYDSVVRYAPHQVFIGNKQPDDLNAVPKPWYDHPLSDGTRNGVFGEIFPEDEFYGWMKVADEFDLLWLDAAFIDAVKGKFASHPFVSEARLKKLGEGKAAAEIWKLVDEAAALPVFWNGQGIGAVRRDHDRDDTLKAEVLMENLMAKTSGSLAILHLLQLAKIAPTDVDYVLDCTEAAIGDRYQRGGGSLSKAYADMVGCLNATGSDVRAFCCAPNHALVTAAALVESGIYRNVVVAGGGCLAKAGMKSAAHVKHNMPILEDVIAGMACLVTRDDGVSPVLRLDSVGKHDVGAGSPQQAIMTSLILKPLTRLGLKMTEIDKYATELHNPEITLPAGSGDTPATNDRIMGSLAALNKQIDRTHIDAFVRERGIPGYSPTQGHVPSAVPFLGHAIKAMRAGTVQRAMFIGKGSLFLGRMSQLSDGISFILEANSNSNAA